MEDLNLEREDLQIRIKEIELDMQAVAHIADTRMAEVKAMRINYRWKVAHRDLKRCEQKIRAYSATSVAVSKVIEEDDPR